MKKIAIVDHISLYRVRLIKFPMKTAISQKRLSISVQNFLGLFVRDVCINTEHFIKFAYLCRNGKT